MRTHRTALIDIRMPLSGRKGWGGEGGIICPLPWRRTPCRRTTARAINATTATPPRQWRQSNTIAVPGEEKAQQHQGHLSTRGPSTQLLLSNSGDQTWHQGGDNKRGGGRARDRLRHNAEAICRCAGHRHSLCHSSSATAATKRKQGARGTTSAWGGQGAMRPTSPVYARTINTVMKNITKRLTWRLGRICWL